MAKVELIAACGKGCLKVVQLDLISATDRLSEVLA